MPSSSGTIGDEVVDVGDRQAQRAADVANGGPGGQRAERADLRDVLLAVLLLHVVDDVAAAVLAEVDVDIGRFLAALVEEPLEQQVVLQRANVAQLQRVSHERADAATARRGRDVVLDGVADEVPHDRGSSSAKPSLLMHVQLAIEPVDHDLRELAARA